jgi:hypothetical protein
MTLTKAVAYPVMLLSATGLFASVALFILSSLGVSLIPNNRLPFLFFGVFLVWLPTVLLMNSLTRNFKQKDIWKAGLRGCPPWMRAGLWVFDGAVMATTFAPALWKGRPGEAGFILFPSAFYAVSFCVMYSLIHVDQFDASRRCLNGHAISPLAKFCEECGAPAAPDVTQLGIPR